MMSFHRLTLRHRFSIAEDAVCLELEAPEAVATRYRYEAGQHLAVRAQVGGREFRRTYSLVAPAGTRIRLGVRVQGVMSRYLAEQLPVGGELEALEPSGRFKPTLAPAAKRRYVAFASGSGITPVLSIVSTVLEAEPAARCMLFYANRSVARTMFLDEVMVLKDRYLTRLSVQFLFSREAQDIELFNGRLDGARVRRLAESEFDPAAVDEYFLCGPGSMVRDVSEALKSLGATGKIHYERFSTNAATAPERTTAGAVPVENLGAVEVTVTMDGRQRRFTMPRGEVVLEAAERAGLALPYSCRAGVCSTCRVRLVSGAATMDRNQALEEWEVKAGYVLCCQARPDSPSLTLSYDDR